jgi:hypothetical protein
MNSSCDYNKEIDIEKEWSTTTRDGCGAKTAHCKRLVYSEL